MQMKYPLMEKDGNKGGNKRNRIEIKIRRRCVGTAKEKKTIEKTSQFTQKHTKDSNKRIKKGDTKTVYNKNTGESESLYEIKETSTLEVPSLGVRTTLRSLLPEDFNTFIKDIPTVLTYLSLIKNKFNKENMETVHNIFQNIKIEQEKDEIIRKLLDTIDNYAKTPYFNFMQNTIRNLLFKFMHSKHKFSKEIKLYSFELLLSRFDPVDTFRNLISMYPLLDTFRVSNTSFKIHCLFKCLCLSLLNDIKGIDCKKVKPEGGTNGNVKDGESTLKANTSDSINKEQGSNKRRKKNFKLKETNRSQEKVNIQNDNIGTCKGKGLNSKNKEKNSIDTVPNKEDIKSSTCSNSNMDQTRQVAFKFENTFICIGMINLCIPLLEFICKNTQNFFCKYIIILICHEFLKNIQVDLMTIKKPDEIKEIDDSVISRVFVLYKEVMEGMFRDIDNTNFNDRGKTEDGDDTSRRVRDCKRNETEISLKPLDESSTLEESVVNLKPQDGSSTSENGNKFSKNKSSTCPYLHIKESSTLENGNKFSKNKSSTCPYLNTDLLTFPSSDPFNNNPSQNSIDLQLKSLFIPFIFSLFKTTNVNCVLMSIYKRLFNLFVFKNKKIFNSLQVFNVFNKEEKAFIYKSIRGYRPSLINVFKQIEQRFLLKELQSCNTVPLDILGSIEQKKLNSQGLKIFYKFYLDYVDIERVHCKLKVLDPELFSSVLRNFIDRSFLKYLELDTKISKIDNLDILNLIIDKINLIIDNGILDVKEGVVRGEDIKGIDINGKDKKNNEVKKKDIKESEIRGGIYNACKKTIDCCNNTLGYDHKKKIQDSHDGGLEHVSKKNKILKKNQIKECLIKGNKKDQESAAFDYTYDSNDRRKDSDPYTFYPSSVDKEILSFFTSLDISIIHLVSSLVDNPADLLHKSKINLFILHLKIILRCTGLLNVVLVNRLLPVIKKLLVYREYAPYSGLLYSTLCRRFKVAESILSNDFIFNKDPMHTLLVKGSLKHYLFENGFNSMVIEESNKIELIRNINKDRSKVNSENNRNLLVKETGCGMDLKYPINYKSNNLQEDELNLNRKNVNTLLKARYSSFSPAVKGVLASSAIFYSFYNPSFLIEKHFIIKDILMMRNKSTRLMLNLLKEKISDLSSLITAIVADLYELYFYSEKLPDNSAIIHPFRQDVIDILFSSMKSKEILPCMAIPYILPCGDCNFIYKNYLMNCIDSINEILFVTSESIKRVLFEEVEKDTSERNETDESNSINGIDECDTENRNVFARPERLEEDTGEKNESDSGYSSIKYKNEDLSDSSTTQNISSKDMEFKSRPETLVKSDFLENIFSSTLKNNFIYTLSIKSSLKQVLRGLNLQDDTLTVYIVLRMLKDFNKADKSKIFKFIYEHVSEDSIYQMVENSRNYYEKHPKSNLPVEYLK